MDLVSAAVWGSAHSDNKPPPRLLSLPCSLPSDGRSATATGFPTMAQRQSKPDIPAVQFCKPSSSPSILHGPNSRARSKTWTLSEHDRFGLRGPLWRARFTGLHCHKISSIPSCYHLFKSSAEHPFTHVSWFTKHKQLLRACCILLHWEYGCSKHQTVSGSIRLYTLFPKLFIVVLFEQEKKKNWKLPNCWTIREWLNKIWCFHLIESCLAIKSKVYEESKISECLC